MYFIYRQGKRKGLNEAARIQSQAGLQDHLGSVRTDNLEKEVPAAELPAADSEAPSGGLRYLDEERQGTALD